MFAEYIEWRSTHPSDDLMTELLNAEVEEQDGTRRPLERTEVLAYTAMIAGAGNETTARLIGFMGQLLGDHPDQRHELVADPSLIASAVEETLRYEPPSPVQARYVARDVELYGHTVTEGSYMLLLNGSANRDAAKFADPDRYDIHRTGGHLSFGQGLHFCLGSALARLEGRVAFEEVLKRWTGLGGRLRQREPSADIQRAGLGTVARQDRVILDPRYRAPQHVGGVAHQCRVDELAVAADRADAVGLGPPVVVHDGARLGDFVGGRREDLVGDRHLVGVDRPLAVVSRAGSACVAARR